MAVGARVEIALWQSRLRGWRVVGRCRRWRLYLRCFKKLAVKNKAELANLMLNKQRAAV